MNVGGRAMSRPVALILQILKHASRVPCLPQASVVPLLAAAFFCGLSPQSSVELGLPNELFCIKFTLVKLRHYIQAPQVLLLIPLVAGASSFGYAIAAGSSTGTATHHYIL